MSETCGDYGGETNSGEPCQRDPGAGTEHEDEGRCHDHEQDMLNKHDIDLSKVEALAAAGLPISSEQSPDIKGYFGISEGTWSNITQKHPELREAYKRGQANASANIGQSLYQRAKNGDITAQKFYLKCQAGWTPTEGREISGPDGGPVEIEYDDMKDMSDEELEVLRKLQRKVTDE